jgi:hypothetical protein
VIQIAILDDYRNVTREIVDWTLLPSTVRMEFFNQRIADQGELIERLQPFQVIVAMRERTPFPRAIVSRLPNLRLISTLLANPPLDVEKYLPASVDSEN